MTDSADRLRYAHTVPSARLKAVVSGTIAGRSPNVLTAYWRLQNGSAFDWFAVWLLQNIRYLPVYAIPLLTAYLIDRIDPAQPAKVFDPLPWVLAATAGMCIANVISTTWAKLIMSRINRTLTASLRRSLLRRMNRLAFSYHDRAQQGALQNKFTLDMSRLEGFQGFLGEQILMSGTVIAVMLCIVAYTNPLLLVVIGLCVPLNLFVARTLWGRIKQSNERFRVAETAFMANLNETLTGLRISRAHATEDFSEERLSLSADQVAKEGMRLDVVNNLFASSSWAVSSFLNMAVLGIGVWLAVTTPHTVTVAGFEYTIKPITIGELTVLMSYYGIVAGSVGGILGGLPSVAAAGDAIASLSQLYDEESEERNTGKRTFADMRGEIELRNVGFRYQNAETKSLDRLDLHVPAGTSMALVGPSGGGKSTLASLILGFYDPQDGQVLIDGQDLVSVDRRSLRRFVGVVSQDVVLFQDTIMGNISWGDREPDPVRVREAARQANALEFIERFPEGLNHVLGDRGICLSGG